MYNGTKLKVGDHLISDEGKYPYNHIIVTEVHPFLENVYKTCSMVCESAGWVYMPFSYYKFQANINMYAYTPKVGAVLKNRFGDFDRTITVISIKGSYVKVKQHGEVTEYALPIAALALYSVVSDYGVVVGGLYSYRAGYVSMIVSVDTETKTYTEVFTDGSGGRKKSISQFDGKLIKMTESYEFEVTPKEGEIWGHRKEGRPVSTKNPNGVTYIDVTYSKDGVVFGRLDSENDCVSSTPRQLTPDDFKGFVKIGKRSSVNKEEVYRHRLVKDCKFTVNTCANGYLRGVFHDGSGKDAFRSYGQILECFVLDVKEPEPVETTEPTSGSVWKNNVGVVVNVLCVSKSTLMGGDRNVIFHVTHSEYHNSEDKKVIYHMDIDSFTDTYKKVDTFEVKS